MQYAYAMTVLTRELGIPARFVVGYTGGTRLKDGSYVVKNTDAHAWTEVFFPSLGWIRFEPTPAGQGTANAPDYMTGGAGHGQGGGSSPILGASQSPGAIKTAPRPGELGPASRQDNNGGVLAGSGERAATPWTAIALAVIAALVLALGLISVVAGPTPQLLTGHPGVSRRRPRAATVAVVAVAAAALVALALYRLMARTTGLNIGVGWATVGIAFGATAAVGLITPAVFRFVLRRWRWMRAADDAGRAHAAWRELHDDLADFGMTSRPSEPPRALAARVTTTLPEPAAAAVTRLALAEERASYAARPVESGSLRRDGTAARRGLAASAHRSSPVARGRLPRLDDDGPGRSRRADSRQHRDTEVPAPAAVRVPRGRVCPARRNDVLAGRMVSGAGPGAPPVPRDGGAGVTSCRPPAGDATALPSAPSSGPAWSAPGRRNPARPALSPWPWLARAGPWPRAAAS